MVDPAMTDLSVFAYRLTEAEKNMAAMSDHIDRIEQARIDDEKKRLLAGVSFLGGIALSLLGLIWAYRRVIIGGAD